MDAEKRRLEEESGRIEAHREKSRIDLEAAIQESVNTETVVADGDLRKLSLQGFLKNNPKNFMRAIFDCWSCSINSRPVTNN